MPTFTVYKGQKEGYPQKGSTTKPDELTGDQVHVKVTASGLCGTGTVEAVGPDVKELKVGDRVGWGYMHNACGHCKDCLEGYNTFCTVREMYGANNLDQGSFADGAVWRESFLFKTPDNIKDEHAAPLGLKPTDVVGIMGVGGLGHLAIQFAAKLGCRVVVLSRSDRKKKEAMDLGAHEFIATANLDKNAELEHPITRLLVTTSAQPDWEQIIPLLSNRSTVYPLSVSDDKLSLPYMPILAKGITIQGSIVANRSQHRQMLDFASLHQIQPIIEKFPMSEDGLKSAMDKLDAGDIYYRAVLVN
ncbi:hypothetical protein IAU60_005837 [Kwoniella sp. DSM 27419]